MQIFSFAFLNKWYTNKIKDLCNLCPFFRHLYCHSGGGFIRQVGSVHSDTREILVGLNTKRGQRALQVITLPLL